MRLLKLTLEKPAANLALDEALLETADARWGDAASVADQTVSLECLRLWEPSSPMVVLGRSSPIAEEVNLDYCRQHRIPVLRRCSGGATIVTGPGCLMYAVVLSYADKPHLRMLDQAHRFVMEQIRQAIDRLGVRVEIRGTSDLTLGDKKVSGNSLRCRRHGFLYHGTLICDFDLSLVSKCLRTPRRQPTYRAGRDHDSFLTRLPLGTEALASSIAAQWQANRVGTDWPSEMTNQLVDQKYQLDGWNAVI